MGRKKVIDDETLLVHARSVFLQRGAFGSTKEIAERAGISEAAIFKRFPTKAELFVAALMPPEVDIASIIADDIEDPREALVATGLQLLDYFREVIPTAMHLMTNPAISMKDIAGHFGPDSADEKINNALAAFLEQRAARGQLKVDVPMASAGLFTSAVHSLALYEMMELHGGVDMAHAVPHFVEALWSGLAPP